MPHIRLYLNESLQKNQFITLSADQSHYVVRVMRQSRGNKIYVFNGQDGEWESVIEHPHKQACQLLLTTQTKAPTNSPDMWLCFAPIKNAPIQSVIQKATELGVSTLQPVITQHTIVQKVNSDRFHKTAIEAAEQCERLDIPTINEPISLITLLENWDTKRVLFFADESGSGKPIASILQETPPSQPAAILIGPEGGFSAEERHLLNQYKYVKPMSMGSRILRADTASIAALSCYMAILGDWK